jgi:PAS domain S-box-containing protein
VVPGGEDLSKDANGSAESSDARGSSANGRNTVPAAGDPTDGGGHGQQVRTCVELGRTQGPMKSEGSMHKGGDRLPSSDFFCQVPTPCGVLSFDGTVRAVNPAFSETFGWADEDVMDTSYLDRVHAEDRDRTQAVFQEAVAEGRRRFVTCRVMHKAGSFRLTYWGIRPCFEDDLVYAGGQDVTDLAGYPVTGMAKDDVGEPTTPGSTPTKRELEVLALAAQGLSTQEVAKVLTLSPTTVKTHLQHAYGKFGVTNRAAAVAKALRLGLI